MREKRICMILPSLTLGGAERVMVTIANGFAETGRDVLLLVVSEGGDLATSISDNVRVKFLGIRRGRYAVFRILQVLRKERPDVVLSTLGYLNIVVGLCGIFFPGTRFVAREANIPTVQLRGKSWKLRMQIRLYKLVYPFFDHIICQSSDMAEDLSRNLQIDPAKLVLIHNPVDMEKLECLSMAPPAEDAAVAIPVSGRILLAVGNMKRQKQFHLLAPLLKALNETSPTTLHVVGDGAERASLERDLARLGLADSVTFWGKLQNPFFFMKRADCLLLTSAFEGFPNVVLEAGACGLPVVAFRCPGVSEEIVQDGINGYLVPQGDIPAMADKVEDVLKGKISGGTARRFVAERFGVKKVLEKYDAVCFGEG